MKEKNKGITLIALVITVIILFILTGVTVTIAINNGLFSITSEAKRKTEKSKKIEMAELYIHDINMKLAYTPNLLSEGITEMSDIPIEFKGKSPNIGWVYVENNLIKKYELYYDDFYILSIDGDTRIKDIKFSEMISVKDFGAVGNGETDDTRAIKEAINYMNNNGGILYFPLGTYSVTASNDGESIMQLNSDKKIEIDFFGSSILLKENGYKAYNIIYAKECSQIELRNGFLLGDRKKHDYNTISSTHEFGYGIFFYQTTLGIAYNMDISDMTGDAIINKNGESTGNVTIDHCNVHHCRRQGISILDSDTVEVCNTKIYNIGGFDNIKGASPSTGIDIEPASGTNYVNKVVLENVKIYDNSSYGTINVSNNVGNIYINNSNIENIVLRNANAEISGSMLIYNKDINIALENVNIKNSNIVLDNNNGSIFISNSNMDFCKVEGKGKCNARLMLNSTANIKNTKFINVRGNGNYNSNSPTDFGIVFRKENYLSYNENNIYEKCVFFIEGELNCIDTEIYDSYMYFSGGVSTLNNLNIRNCSTKFNDNAEIILNNCSVTDSGKLDKFIK